MRMVTGVALVSLACLGLAPDNQKAAPKPSTYTDGLYGFSIQAPGFPKAAEGARVVPVMMLGPAEGGFSSNVNILVHLGKTTPDEYLRVSLNQFKAAGWKVNSLQKTKVSGRAAIRLDYEGRVRGRDLRWLALAVVDADKVCLVTCTTTKDGFERYQKEFQACIESFKLEEDQRAKPVAAQ